MNDTASTPTPTEEQRPEQKPELSGEDLLYAIAATCESEGGVTATMLRELYIEYGFQDSWDAGTSGGIDELLAMIGEESDLPEDDPEPDDDSTPYDI